ncbi:VP1 [Raccoon polyomavirus]|uniref:Capsid protein VP1 n=1 Tax=Raccoon polyomavirus TaxID=1219896 RepID=J7G293_9POLY|nr:VP1 [Raccoon polyomavirus]AFP58020.1 VP1 [Raccoon polyomavirus]AMB49041.1 VP1 [Raccoon polyomavirus]
MAPKRKGAVCKTSQCKPSQTCKRVCTTCPVPATVPKLIVKGGVEVLDIVTGPDSITEIELYLQPRMGVNSTDIEHYSDWFGYSYDLKPMNPDSPSPEHLPSYSCARIQLPLLNEDMTCGTLMMWEAVSVKTEVIGINTLIDVHHLDQLPIRDKGAGVPIEGLNYHMFAVGGEPLDLQGIVMDYKTKYPEGEHKPITIKTITKKDLTPKNQGMDPTAKAVLDRDGYYPIEVWCPDPAKNENSRYFGSYTGGTNTPPVLQFTNSLTTVLLDENGVGPLCKGDGLFVSCADICGFFNKTEGMAFRGLPRYFKITVRKRWVKNPYPVTSLISSLFNNLMPKIKGQPMEGKDNQIEEVRIYEGSETIPADPDIVRYIDKFGQRQTEEPK